MEKESQGKERERCLKVLNITNPKCVLDFEISEALKVIIKIARDCYKINGRNALHTK